MRIELPAGDWELPQFYRSLDSWWHARIRNGGIELSFKEKNAWWRQRPPDDNIWPRDMVVWLTAALAGLGLDRQVDKPRELAILKALMQSAIDSPPNLEAIKKLVAEAK